MYSNKDVEQYYDLSQTHYKRVWDLQRSRSLHYGYWDATTKNFHEALLNINKILAAKAGINKHHKVLDAGCGIGGSSLWLAKNIDCKVTGISLSAKQVQTANNLALAENLQSLASFEQLDFTATHYESESFDIIWAIESVCHSSNKSKFINEAYRLLKKGGKLILADFFKKENLAEKDAALITQWANGWAIDDFATIENFTEQLNNAGFHHPNIEDATTKIIPSAKRLYRAYFPGVVGGFLYKLFNPKPTIYGRKNIDTAFLQYKALKQNLWTYNIVLAEK